VPPPNYQTTIPTAVDDGSWKYLNIRYVRITVPWDIAYHGDRTIQVTRSGHSYPLDPNSILQVEQQCLDFWLADINRANASRAAGQPAIQPEVQFRPDYNDVETNRAGRPVIVVPDLGTYRKALQAFTGTYSCTTPSGQPEPTCPLPPGIPASLGMTAMTRVSTLTPWGEPDFYSKRGKLRASGARDGQFYMPFGGRRFDQADCDKDVRTCGPVLAAQMWVTAAALCHGCTVIAGTFGSNPVQTMAYLKVYAQNLNGRPRRPAVWAIDPYTDIENYEMACWDNHPPSLIKVHKYPKHPPTPRRPCSAPASRSTLVWHFSKELGRLHYGSRTRIWLGEISAFYIDTIAHQGAWYGFPVEHQAADYLLKQLARPRASTPSGDPYVARLYYMRYEDGSGYPDFALVLDNIGTTKTGPVAAHTEYRVPAYAAFRFRSSPQQ
jgi:hypothetical protein